MGETASVEGGGATRGRRDWGGQERNTRGECGYGRRTDWRGHKRSRKIGETTSGEGVATSGEGGATREEGGATRGRRDCGDQERNKASPRGEGGNAGMTYGGDLTTWEMSTATRVGTPPKPAAPETNGGCQGKNRSALPFSVLLGVWRRGEGGENVAITVRGNMLRSHCGPLRPRARPTRHSYTHPVLGHRGTSSGDTLEHAS